MRHTLLAASAILGLISIGTGPRALGEIPSPQAKPNLFVISESDCKHLLRHWPRDDVTYKPGIGVDGQPVSPADMEGGYGRFNLPAEVTFDLLIKLREDELLEPEGSVGLVSVDLTTGIVSLNDEELMTEEKRALVAFCQSL